MTRWVLVVPVWFVFNLALDETTARSHANPWLSITTPKTGTAYFVVRRSATGAAPREGRSAKPTA